uniref:Deleted in lung and esophageal cancer protein 1 Ig-like domain-containing protein n=1 Tax=Alexandrium monilatum TaxID=311494 RepID=A0A7S4VFH8_9DINO
MLRDLERSIEIGKGTVLQHENVLSVSKPEEPNHYKSTASQKHRMQTRNIQPTLTESQRETMAQDLAERRRRQPPAPNVLNAEERKKNREIVKRMQTKVNFLRNPRYQADRSAAARGEACPFAISPGSLVFRNYEVGGVYELDCEFRNTTQVGRRLRVLPCPNPCFSIDALRYDGDAGGRLPPGAGAVVAPGMAARLTVRFAPQTLNDASEELTVGTEVGDFKLPLLARRVQPRLELQQPVDCGCILAGNSAAQRVRLSNRGGEGSFRLIPADEATDPSSFSYESLGEEIILASPDFSVRPASFYLEAGESIDLEIHFAAAEVGRHHCPLLIECDNGVKTPLELVGITDAVRLEFVRWPTTDAPLQPRETAAGVSPWSYIPWLLNWLDPGAQVGGVQPQTIVISNGGYLPIKVRWRLAKPPGPLLSKLAVGDQPRLTEELMNDMKHWSTCHPSTHGLLECPFTVSPAFAEVEPFSTAEFVFSYHAHEPVGRRSTAFACLEATEIPASGQCLLHYGRLLQLQDEMQPTDYPKGLPLFGGAVSSRFDRVPPLDGAEGPGTASCTVSAVCLQGVSVRPSVTCRPPAITLPGAVLPFVAQVRELRLQNAGSRPACFRVRLSSASAASGPLWVLGPHEAGPRPLTLDAEEPGDGEDADPEPSALRRSANRLVSQWPPLPPQGPGAEALPGFGASATVVVEPWEGFVPAGEETVLQVSIRAPRELDIDGQLVVDLPISPQAQTDEPPLAVAVLGAVRAPRVGLRYTSCVDYGVVRAHAQHTRTMKVNNPSDMPMLVRLRKHTEKDDIRDRHISSRDPMLTRLNSCATPAYTVSPYLPPYKTPAAAPTPSSSSTSPCDVHGIFPLRTHQEIVDLYTSAVRRGSRAGYTLAPGLDPQDPNADPWVHARSGCLDKSGRGRTALEEIGGGTNAEEACDFLFKPECLVLWPHQTAEVEVTLRTGGVGQYHGLVEAVGFDSLHSQCIEVFAEIQLPRLCISTQHCYFPVTYAQTSSEPKELRLRNDSDLPGSFRWAIPSKKPNGCLEVEISPSEGTVPPRSEIDLVVRARPTRLPEGGRLAKLTCPLFTHELLQPILLLISARIFGPEVDYDVVPLGEPVPKPTLRRTETGSVDATYSVTTGRAKRGQPVVDFGEMELLKSKSMQVVLYNRTGIGTPFTAKIRQNPAEEPAGGARTQACRLEEDPSPTSEPRRFDFSSEPRAAPAIGLDEEDARTAPPRSRGGTAGTRTGMQGKSRTNRFEPKARRTAGNHAKATGKKKQRFLLDDKHEKQSFRSTGGAALVQQKEEKELGMVALQKGRGYAVQLRASSEKLEPFGNAVITLTCFSDLPGLMEDELVLNIPELAGHADGQDFRIPVRLASFGNPLYLPEQQVGLNLALDPPRLNCGIIVPSEKLTTQRFRVGNNSSAKMKIAWKIYSSRQLDNTSEDRHLLRVALCKRQGQEEDLFLEDNDEDEEMEAHLGGKDGEAVDEDLPCCFKLWAEEPPEVQDPFALTADGEPPLKVEPEEAVIPIHGSTWFTVTMLASKATTAAANHYAYKLVGKGRFAEDRSSSRAKPGAEGGKPFEQTVLSANDTQVRCLPAVPLDPAELHDSDSDAEPAPRTARTSKTASKVSAEADDADVTAVCKSPGKQLSAEEPDEDVISTIIIDCVGDCILPRLTVDKKANPSVEEYQRMSADAEVGIETGEPETLHCPVFKFTHSVLTPPVKKTSGATHGAFPGTAQIPGIVSYLVRNITLSNHSACNIGCRFCIDGPFRIREIAQMGRPPVKPAVDPAATRKKPITMPMEAEDPLRQLFVVGKLETLTLQVEFALDSVHTCNLDQHKSENVFHGDLTVQYPRDLSAESGGDTDLQRVHLVGTLRRPAVRVTVVPRYELDRPLEVDHADLPPWGEAQPVIVDFGSVHVEAIAIQRRCILLSNLTNVLARWQLLHVGRKKRPPLDIGQTTREDEDARALDEKDVFEFDVTGGELFGPSKEGIVSGTKERQPHWCPQPHGVARAPPLLDEERYEPQRVEICFRPKRNELYKCKFRIQVESGISVDFVCRGCGSYKEEDDPVGFAES